MYRGSNMSISARATSIAGMMSYPTPCGVQLDASRLPRTRTSARTIIVTALSTSPHSSNLATQVIAEISQQLQRRVGQLQSYFGYNGSRMSGAREEPPWVVRYRSPGGGHRDDFLHPARGAPEPGISEHLREVDRHQIRQRWVGEGAGLSNHPDVHRGVSHAAGRKITLVVPTEHHEPL